MKEMLLEKLDELGHTFSPKVTTIIEGAFLLGAKTALERVLDAEPDRAAIVCRKTFIEVVSEYNETCETAAALINAAKDAATVTK